MEKYIFGHKNPDTDSVVSAIAYSHFKNALGDHTKPIILGRVNNETEYVLEQIKMDTPEMIQLVKKNQPVILVDHNEFQQSVSGIEQAEILEVIDHHRIANFETKNPLYMRVEPLGCTATIIAKMFNEKNIPIPKDIAFLLVSAIISDTLLFKSPTSTNEDVEIASKLAGIANVNLQEYGIAMLKAGANIQGKTVKELLLIDSKEFEFDGTSTVASLNVIGFEEVLEIKESIKNKMEYLAQERDLSFYFLLVTDVLKGESIAFIADRTNKTIAGYFGGENAAGYLVLPDMVSRKKQLIPKLNDIFEK